MSTASTSAVGGEVTASNSHEFYSQTIYTAERPTLLLASRETEQQGAAELFVVQDDGMVLRLAFGPVGWIVEPLPVMVPAMPEGFEGITHGATICVGNVIADVPREELVIQTSRTVSVLVEHAPGLWEAQIAADWERYLGMMWGARVGQINPSHPAEEIFYLHEAIFDFSNGYHLVHDPRDGWIEQLVYSAEVGMDSAIGDVNPAQPGFNEIVITTEMGPTYELTPSGSANQPWTKRLLWDDSDNAGWRVLVDNVLPERTGNEIVYTTRHHNSVLLSYEGEAGHEMDLIYSGGAPPGHNSQMSGIALGQLDPTHSALDIVGVDSFGTVHLVRYDGASWTGNPIWQDPDGEWLTAVAIGHFRPHCSGPDIVVTGESGVLTLLSAHPPVVGDLTGDCRVGVSDLLKLLAHWGICPGCPADLNGDGSVDVSDLLILFGNWG